MKKSKSLYIVALVILIGVALIDHIIPNPEKDQIAVGQPQEQPLFDFQFAFLTK